MEWLWACLLLVASLHRETRPLAFLMAAKWAANYSLAYADLWLFIPFVDIVAGLLAALYLQGRCLLFSFAFLMTALVHFIFWVAVASSIYIGVFYYHALLWLFTAQLLLICNNGCLSALRTFAWPVMRRLRPKNLEFAVQYLRLFGT